VFVCFFCRAETSSDLQLGTRRSPVPGHCPQQTTTGRHAPDRSVDEADGQGAAHDDPGGSTARRLDDQFDEWVSRQSRQDGFWVGDAEE
jgi:hypothetical protein